MDALLELLGPHVSAGRPRVVRRHVRRALSARARAVLAARRWGFSAGDPPPSPRRPPAPGASRGSEGLRGAPDRELARRLDPELRPAAARRPAHHRRVRAARRAPRALPGVELGGMRCFLAPAGRPRSGRLPALARHQGVEERSDTAQSAQYIQENQLRDCAPRGRLRPRRRALGMDLVATSRTRELVRDDLLLAPARRRTSSSRRRCPPWRTTVVFLCLEAPGALYKALACLAAAARHSTLSKLESRCARDAAAVACSSPPRPGARPTPRPSRGGPRRSGARVLLAAAALDRRHRASAEALFHLDFDGSELDEAAFRPPSSAREAVRARARLVPARRSARRPRQGEPRPARDRRQGHGRARRGGAHIGDGAGGRAGGDPRRGPRRGRRRARAGREAAARRHRRLRQVRAVHGEDLREERERDRGRRERRVARGPARRAVPRCPFGRPSSSTSSPTCS